MGLVLPSRQFRKNKGKRNEAGQRKCQVENQETLFSQIVVNKWNRLSEEVVSAGTVDTF